MKNQAYKKTLYFGILILVNCTHDKFDFKKSTTNCDTTQVSYKSKIVPILKENCYSCHATGKSQLNFSIYDDMAFIAADSELVFSLDAKNSYLLMPPETERPLTSCEKETIKAWIRQGYKNN
jgi:uncharacterized membrane protein